MSQTPQRPPGTAIPEGLLSVAVPNRTITMHHSEKVPNGYPCGSVAAHVQATHHAGAHPAAEFLQLLGKDPAQTWFRVIRQPRDGTRHPRGGADLHGFGLAELSRDNANGWSVYYVSGNASTASGVKNGRPTGAVQASDVTSCNALFAEWDNQPIEWQLEAWRVLGLPEPTVMVLTGGKSVHCYWRLAQPMPPDQWRVLQSRLIEHCGSDEKCKDPCRVMRLPGFAYIDKTSGKPNGEVARVVQSSGASYSADQIAACLPQLEPKPAAAAPEQTTRSKSKASSSQAGNLPPRSFEEIEAAAAFIPQRVVGKDTYETSRRALCGCAAALAEIGLPEDKALNLLASKWPDRATAQQALQSSTTREPKSFWAIAAEHGYDMRRHDLQRPAPEPPEGTPAQQAPWGQGNTPAELPAGRQGGKEEPKEREPATFRELIQSAYRAVLADDLDSEMAAAAELKTRFRATDQQISRRMIEAHLATRVKKTAKQGDGVDLGAVQALTYRQDGFTIAGDVCLTYGSFGTGKTTYTVAKMMALCKGEGFLDRSAPCKPGKALFIATDSGAPALKKTLADLEIDPNTHPLFKGPEQRIWIWAHAPEQGHEAWVCDLRGLVKLEQFIEEKGIDLVVIDSAKSVSSGAGWQYTDNDAVKVLLRYMREAVAAPTGCSIEFISHDGTQAGSHSGAKAWAEDPSMVVALIPIKESNDDAKITGIRAEFKKDRAAAVDPRRFVRYRLTEGRLELVEGSEVVGNCADAVLQILSEAHGRGHHSLGAKAIDEEAFARFKATSKTVRNTLTQLVNARRAVRSGRGRYALSPGEMQARGTPPTPSREEVPETPSQDRANPSSRPSSRREEREEGEVPDSSRREDTGKKRESSSSKGSREVPPDKRGLGTPPAAATDPALVELVEVPPPPQQPALLAIPTAAPIGSAADVLDSDGDDPAWGARPEAA